MEGHLKMSVKERRRLVVFERLRDGQMTLGEAACRLEISYRQCCRSYWRYRSEGAKGLVHRSRGRPSNRAMPDEFRRRVIERYEQRYDGFGPTLAAEKLVDDGLVLDHETLRRWLLAANKWTKKRRRRQHRSWRERRPHFGELVQLDGSHHNWFGDGHPRACLLNMVDDATGTTFSIMAQEETTEAAMRILWSWIERYGVPTCLRATHRQATHRQACLRATHRQATHRQEALYTDKKNVFVTDREPTIDEQPADIEHKTAFGEACRKLGIEIITANSPQAKGRVERSHGVYQDRFVKPILNSWVLEVAWFEWVMDFEKA